MRRAASAALAAWLVAASGCAQGPAPPAGWQFGLPIYPNAKMTGKSAATATIVVYVTGDSVDDVYNWYLAQLPEGTPHAFSLATQQATFALFDARARRTVHVQREGAATTIELTKVIGR